MLMSLYKPRKQRGIGLLELMLSISIIAILLVMATRYYLSTRNAEGASEIVRTVGQIYAAGEQFFAANRSFTSPAFTVDSVGLPSNVSPFSSSTIKITGTATGYTIAFGPIPAGACTNLSTLIVNANIPGMAITDPTTCPTSSNTSAFTVTYTQP